MARKQARSLLGIKPKYEVLLGDQKPAEMTATTNEPPALTRIAHKDTSKLVFGHAQQYVRRRVAGMAFCVDQGQRY